MAKISQSKFKFRRTDIIGAASAEDDAKFLGTCFVETEEYEWLKSKEDIRQIVLGRTGSGKSALFERLKQEEEERTISIEPHELALTYVSNSLVLRYFSDLGVNLDPFYKLLWRHVLTVEILRRHFESHVKDEEGGLWNLITNMFSAETRRDKDVREAVQYLKKWGEKFWIETEYRVHEITNKLERELEGELELKFGAKPLSGKASSSAGWSLSNEERAEIISRGQRVVSEAQVQDLNKVRALLESVLSDRQKNYYILIDRLDEDWVEEKLRYRLIMALMDSIKEISRVSNIKILIAIRHDLIDRVFSLAQAPGFQEEKYRSLYLPLRWSPEKIIEVLDKRVDDLVARRYEKSKQVTHSDLLPGKIDKVPTTRFITDRAQRPRDVISFFNECIKVAKERHRCTVAMLKQAEGEYSRQRLAALRDEWNANYPGLLDFVDILKERPPSFSLSQVGYDAVADLCLHSTIDLEGPDDPGILRKHAREVSEGAAEVNGFKQMLFSVFHRIGLIGLKLETFESALWIDDLGQEILPSEIDDTTGVVVHPAYWRILGIRAERRN